MTDIVGQPGALTVATTWLLGVYGAVFRLPPKDVLRYGAQVHAIGQSASGNVVFGSDGDALAIGYPCN